MMRTLFLRLLPVLVVAAHASLVLGDEIDFDKDIRPILARKCFHCHGPDENTREAGLRLDLRENAFADLGGYSAFVAGDVDSSEAIERILSDDESYVMPPPESKIELTEEEKKQLTRWVENGAPWQEHWSFVKPKKPSLPKVELKSWPANPIDHFVLARLEREQLRPSRAASRTKLLRRVTLDLTGVPPTETEVREFLEDESADAYEKAVDRLLGSPRYGERMAWDWLEAARYADTDGFQNDPTRSMWPWRDWLVHALNDNMPFDQFTREMLAGDLIPGATDEQIVASGFNRNHMYNGEGGRIAEETRVENVFDRTETTSTVWLGLTMTCARCHDHKFDPISQAEYYQLFALFNNTSETGRGGANGRAAPSRKYFSPAQKQKLRDIQTQLAERRSEFQKPNPEVDKEQAAWETSLEKQIQAFRESSQPTKWEGWWQSGPVEKEIQIQPHRIKRFFRDWRKRNDSFFHLHDEFEWKKVEYEDRKVHALPNTIGVTYLARKFNVPSDRTIHLSLGSDDHIAVWLDKDGKPVHETKVGRAAQADQDRVSLQVSKGEHLIVLRIRNTGGAAGFYFDASKEAFANLPIEITKIIAKPVEERTQEESLQLQNHYRTRFSETLKPLVRQIESLSRQKKRLEDTAPTVMIMDELPTKRRRKTRILYRGIYDKPTEMSVIEGTPSVLHKPRSRVKNRLELADWIVSADNPLTARVTVNRYWQTFFGRGLVASTEDFGQTGTRPTHPQLLDWLAIRFMESGWDVKAMHKTIVMSQTYRQSSATLDSLGDADKAAEKDPSNHLYWKSPRYRMPSWMLRDQALAVSGLLVQKQGGPSVRPYQPKGIWAEATFGKIKYQPDQGESLYRRSLYVFWRRIVGPTMFFDAGKRQTCEVKPTRTNTPLHALITLNETTYVEAARKLAQEVLGVPANDRIEFVYQRLLARSASSFEIEMVNERIQRLKKHFQKAPTEANELLKVGASSRDEQLDPVEHAAWTVVCSTLMNLDEFLCRE